MESNLYIGLMTGTSIDGIDAAILDFSGTPKTIATLAHPIPEELRHLLHSLCTPETCKGSEIEAMGEADAWLGKVLADAVNALLAKSGTERSAIRAIGCHGQTIRHRPGAKHPFTLQIGDPNTVSELTGITVIGDLRRRDVAAGGQGAPLAPGFHSTLFQSQTQNRVLVNIGGIANISLLPAGEGNVTGYDTGPGNTLMDAWVRRHLGKDYDESG